MPHRQPFQRKKIRLLEGILSYTLLMLGFSAVLRFAAAYFSHSISLFADAVTTVLLGMATIVGISRLRRTATAHLISENRTDRGYQAGIALLALLSAVVFAFFAIHHLYDRHPMDNAVIGLGLGAVTLLLNLCIGVLLVRLGRQYRLRSLTSGTPYIVFALSFSSLTLATVAVAFLADWRWLDPVMALLQSAVLLYVSFWLLVRSTASRNWPPMPQRELETASRLLDEFSSRHQITCSPPQGMLIHDRPHIYVVLLVPEDWTVVLAQRRADELEDDLQRLYPTAELEIHLESGFDTGGTARPGAYRGDVRGQR